jgi:hypothetical protein
MYSLSVALDGQRETARVRRVSWSARQALAIEDGAMSNRRRDAFPRDP